MANCVNLTNGTLHQKFSISNSCALFDFGVYTVLMGSLCLLGIVGNIVSFAVLLRDKGGSATSFLLRALAFADTLVLIAAMPLYVLPAVYPYSGALSGYYSVYLTVLPVLWPMYLIPYTTTVFVTVLVSMHRYCAVCRPFRSAKVYTYREAQHRVACIVLFSIVYNVPRFFEYHSVRVCVDQNRTKDVFEMSELGDNRIYRIFYANLLYFVVIHGGPLLLIGFFNVQLIVALKRRQQRWAERGKGWYQQDVSLVLVVVMCVFIVCQTPTFVDHILWTCVDAVQRTCGRWHYYYTAVGDLLAILNSSVNFVIYILTSRNFRHGLMMCSFGPRLEYIGLHPRSAVPTEQQNQHQLQLQQQQQQQQQQ